MRHAKRNGLPLSVAEPVTELQRLIAIIGERCGTLGQIDAARSMGFSLDGKKGRPGVHHDLVRTSGSDVHCRDEIRQMTRPYARLLVNRPSDGSTCQSGRERRSVRNEDSASTLALRARAVGVTKYRPPRVMLQSGRRASTWPVRSRSKAMNSGSSAMARPASSVGIRASTLVTRNGPTGVTVAPPPALFVNRQTSRLAR